jgi:hypothetical protein
VFGHATCQVRVVVLRPKEFDPFALGEFQGEPGGGIIWVQIVDEQVRKDREKLLVRMDCLNVSAVGFVMVEVAKVMTQKGVFASTQGKSGL